MLVLRGRKFLKCVIKHFILCSRLLEDVIQNSVLVFMQSISSISSISMNIDVSILKNVALSNLASAGSGSRKKKKMLKELFLKLCICRAVQFIASQL